MFCRKSKLCIPHKKEKDLTTQAECGILICIDGYALHNTYIYRIKYSIFHLICQVFFMNFLHNLFVGQAL